jgi:hypothetical protein
MEFGREVFGCFRQRRLAFELRSQATDQASCKTGDRLERLGESAADTGHGRAFVCAGGIGAEPIEQHLAPTERPPRELLSPDQSRQIDGLVELCGLKS